MPQLAERHETLQAGFDALRQEPAFGTGPLAEAREAAFGRFLERGFPTTREEEWRFTNIAPIAAVSFERPPAGRPLPSDVAAWADPALGLPIIVTNGRVDRLPDGLPDGVTVRGLKGADAAAVLPPRPDEAGALVDLNTALFEDVVLLDVRAGAVVPEPLHVVFVSAPDTQPVLVSPRLVVTVGENAQCSIVESYVDTGAAASLANAVTDVRVAPGAVVDHVKFQRQTDASFHLATMFVHLGRAATFASRSLTLGARIARNDAVATLDGEGAECTFDGLYVGTGDSLIDNHTTIDHAQPHCPSHEVYKGILTGRARAVFNGKILVREDAQKTDAKQTNKALLLSGDAQVNTKPQLEIFADDVKCTHGAAIGQLDDDALFYLKARGIGSVEARNMLIHAFAGEVLDHLRSEPLRRAATRRVEEMLGLPA